MRVCVRVHARVYARSKVSSDRSSQDLGEVGGARVGGKEEDTGREEEGH